MSKQDRKAIGEILEGRFDQEFSQKCENKIYEMCVTLAENYEEDLEDVYKKFAYEKVGEFFSVDSGYDKILKDLENLVFGWDSCVYAEYRKRRDIENAQLTQTIKVEKGEFPCRNRDCRSKECYFYLTQDRSADEAMTVNVICTKCGTKYKINN